MDPILIITLSVEIVLAIVVIALLNRMTGLQRDNRRLAEANQLKDRLLALRQEQSHPEEQALNDKISKIGGQPEIHLSSREKEIVRLCCDGLMSKEIANKLNITQRTVETHKTNIFRKLGINSTVELVRFAREAGILN